MGGEFGQRKIGKRDNRKWLGFFKELAEILLYPGCSQIQGQENSEIY